MYKLSDFDIVLDLPTLTKVLMTKEQVVRQNCIASNYRSIANIDRLLEEIRTDHYVRKYVRKGI